MKQELINRIMPNCLLPMSYMVTWINNLEFQNEPADALRQLILSKVKSNGQLLPDGWELLLNNVVFEPNASITPAQALGWITAQNCPTCNQLQQIILDTKLKVSFPLVVETPVLDLLELDFDLVNISNIQENKAFMRDGKQYYVHIPKFKIKNFDLIKDANPYLIVERLKPSKKGLGGSIKKNGWKRDRTLMVLGGEFWKSWEGSYWETVTEEYYRPNEIPLTNAKQSIDLMLHNYFGVRKLNENKTITKKGFGNKSVSLDKIQPRMLIPNTQQEPYIRPYRKQKINLRLRIGFKIGDIEKISKPLKYFSIFAETFSVNNNGNQEQQVLISIGK